MNRYTCPKCGYVDVTPLEPETTPEASEGPREDLPSVRAVLYRLCNQAYEMPYRGAAWDTLINKALEEIMPLVRSSN